MARPRSVPSRANPSVCVSYSVLIAACVGGCPPISQIKSRRRPVQGSGSGRAGSEAQGTRVGTLQPCGTVAVPTPDALNRPRNEGTTQGPRQCVPSSTLASHLEWTLRIPPGLRKRGWSGSPALRTPCSLPGQAVPPVLLLPAGEITSVRSQCLPGLTCQNATWS